MISQEFANGNTIDSAPKNPLKKAHSIEKIDLNDQKAHEYRKKDSLVTKFLQRLSKPELPSRHKKTKSKTKPQPKCNQSSKISEDKSVAVDVNVNNNHSRRSNNFRKIFKRFGKRKEKNNHLSESVSSIGSKPSLCSAVQTTTNVRCIGSCNDVNIDRICKEEFEKYDSSSVDCILDYHAKKLLQDQESVSSNSLDLREHEQPLSPSNTHIASIISENNKSENKKETEHNIDNGNSKVLLTNYDVTKNDTNVHNDVSLEIRHNKPSEEPDILLRKSSRPSDIQLRRSRVASQSSIARSSLIMVAVSQNSPRTKVIGNNIGTPINNAESPSNLGNKLDFETENKAIDEEKMEKNIEENFQRNGNDFLKIAARYEMKINAKIEIVQQYMNSSVDAMNDDVIGQLNTTVGLAKLLLSEKFVQFRGLCEQNLSGSDDNGFRTLCCDLEGYLMTLEIQIADLEKNFQLVETIRTNQWQLPVNSGDVGVRNEAKKKKIKPKTPRQNSSMDTQRSLEAKKRIAEYKKMCASKNQGSANLFTVE